MPALAARPASRSTSLFPLQPSKGSTHTRSRIELTPVSFRTSKISASEPFFFRKVMPSFSISDTQEMSAPLAKEGVVTGGIVSVPGLAGSCPPQPRRAEARKRRMG
jgi:hypothetical protein